VKIEDKSGRKPTKLLTAEQKKSFWQYLKCGKVYKITHDLKGEISYSFVLCVIVEGRLEKTIVTLHDGCEYPKDIFMDDPLLEITEYPNAKVVIE
jgi:hypothetical protein